MRPNMDNLPTVISCCFCCFLRAGTVMIAIFSFISGLFFAPNVSSTRGWWDMDPVLSYYSAATETTVQVLLGVVSIMLCVVSVLLLIGSLCNMPTLILVYQWGAVTYCFTVFILLLVLAMFCFFVHTNCVVAGALLCGLSVIEVLFAERDNAVDWYNLFDRPVYMVTVYFVIVANSLRITQLYSSSSEMMI